MTRDEVLRKMAEFVEHVRRERELRDQLLALEFNAPNEKALQRALERQQELLRQIRDLRDEQMLPMIEEMAKFVGERQREMLGPPPPPET